MPTVKVKAPDGKTLSINVPDGASQEQILRFAKAQYQKSEPQQAAKPAEQKESVARTVLDQGLQGATFGFADEVTDRVGAGIASLVTGQPYNELLQEARGLTSERQERQFEQNPLISIGSNVAGGLVTGVAGAVPKVLSGTAAKTGLRGALNAVPQAGANIGNIVRSGNVAARAGKGAALGTASGAAFGAGTAEDGERLSGARQGAVLGGLTGAAIPVVGAAGRGVKDAIVPQIDEALKPLAQRARDFGIPLRADQVAPTRARRTVQKISQEIPLSGADAFEDTQRKAFTKAVAKTIGETSDDLSPSTIQSFRQRVSKTFDDALDGVEVQAGQDDLAKLGALRQEASETIEEGLSVVEKNIDKTLEILKSGAVKGEKLASLRSELLKKASRAKGASGEYIGEIIEQLDEVIERNLPEGKAASLADARRQWRNFRTIQPLLQKSNDGTINPTQLLNRVASSKFIDASSAPVGKDDLIDLARIGKEFLPKQGGSDTFQKSALTGSSIIGGAGLVTNPLATITTATAVPLANRGLQKTVSSQKLIDSALKASREPARIRNTPLTALIAGETAAR